MHERNRPTLLPFSISARSQTAISPANLANSRTCVSRSDDHRFTISSIVLPRNIEGGGTAIAGVATPGAVGRLDVAVDDAIQISANVAFVQCQNIPVAFLFLSASLLAVLPVNENVGNVAGNKACEMQSDV